VERFALNLADARIADNDGARPRGEPLDPEGPPARQVRFSVEEMVAAITAAGVAAEASAHAGTFCCNAAFYRALAPAGVLGRRAPLVAFIHVPARRGRMNARIAARGLRAALAALAAP
jgi:pyroglutamyl-peptidase